MTVQTCLCLIARPAHGPEAGDGAPGPAESSGLAPGRELLLGFKKTGFGAGRWVGIGGHVEDGEDPLAAAVREVAEETSLVVQVRSLAYMASLSFVFPARPSWDQTAHVYVTTEFAGEPTESREIMPRWFPAHALPYDGMWDDAKYWMPAVLAGRPVAAEVTFGPDCATVTSIRPQPSWLPPPSVLPGRPRI